MRNLRNLRLSLGFLCLLIPCAAWAAPSSCPETPVQALALPHLKAALKAGRPVVIAALGSSSTWGAMARDIGDSYPARLQDDLAKLLPGSEISVINRGIGGQDAAREDRRMARDVLALKPTLVIWQVGANAAAWRENVGEFSDLVSQGLLRLQAARVDIVLMDNQRSIRLLASQDDAPINHALLRLARAHDASLFSRDALMRAWQKSVRSPEAFLAADGMHMNDRGYACVAAALADSIAKAVQ